MDALKVVAIILLAVGMLLWVAHVLPPMPLLAVPEAPEDVHLASPLPPIEDGPATIVGVAIYNADVEPPVPYIEYESEDGEVLTKQLIFRNERGCSPADGDLPCVVEPNAPYVPYGERVRVTGTIVGDQILVDSVRRI